jgi:preprotein translocase subunit YajC
MTAALALPIAAAAAKKSSGSPALLIFVLIAAGFYFLIYRPQQRKAKLAKEAVKSYDVGDEVLTAGGIVGHIIDIDGDRVTLETSVGASFVVLRQYVLRKLEEPVPAEPDEDDDSYDGDETGEYDDDEQPEAVEGSAEDETDDEDDSEDTGGATTEDHPAGHGNSSGDDNHGPDGSPTT